MGRVTDPVVLFLKISWSGVSGAGGGMYRGTNVHYIIHVCTFVHTYCYWDLFLQL